VSPFPNPTSLEKIRQLVGAARQLLKGPPDFGAVLAGPDQGGSVVVLGHAVEVVQRPVEVRQVRPAEPALASS
jgi:hypothetical protein